MLNKSVCLQWFAVHANAAAELPTLVASFELHIIHMRTSQHSHHRVISVGDLDRRRSRLSTAPPCEVDSRPCYAYSAIHAHVEMHATRFKGIRSRAREYVVI